MDKIITILGASDPFYMIWLMNVEYETSQEVKRYKIQIQQNKILLTVNMEWLESLPLQNRLNAIRQAVLNIVLLHWYYGDGLELQKYLVACELESNEYLTPINGVVVDENDLTVPLLNMAFGLSMERKQDFKYYYDRLPDFPEMQQKAPTSAMGNGEAPNEGEGYGGEDIKDRKEVTLQQFKSTMEEANSKSPNAGSHINDFISKWLEQFEIKPAKIRWIDILKRRVSQFGRQIEVSATRKKRNKYYAHNPGQKHNFIGSVLVAIDTSGSIDREQYEEFICEIALIAKKFKVWLLHADTAIRYYEKFDLNKAETFKIHGGGGTDFTPVIDFFNKSEHTICIYFTDTYGSTSVEPKKTTVWVTDVERSAPQLTNLKNSELLVINSNK